MFRIRSLILITLSIFLIGKCLHLHDASSSYVSYLQNQQYNLKSKLDSLANKITDNYNDAAKQNDIDKKIQLLQNYIKEQRLLLGDITLQTANDETNSSQWVCPALPQQKKNQIENSLLLIGQDLKDIDNTLNPLDKQKIGQPLDPAKQQVKEAEKTADKLKDILNSKGQEIQPSSIHPDKKTNLNAPNWVLDGKKVDELNDEYKKAAESGALQICKSDEPFYSQKYNKCIKCDAPKQYFSLRTSECIQCYNYDQNEHRCKDNQGSKTNFNVAQEKIIVPQGKTLEDYLKKDDPNKISCPDSAPFFTGEQCIKCQTYFDVQSKQCKKCEGKNYFDPKTHICKMQQKKITNVDNGKTSLIIPNDKTLNDIEKDNKKLQEDYKVVVCPKQKPYYNDYECISCAQGTYFSLIQKSCGTCETGTFYNKETNHCENKSYYPNLQDPNWSSSKTYPQIQKQVQQKAKDPLFQKCPTDKPFSTGKQCIQCSKDQHFDYDKKQCLYCDKGKYFNKNLHICTVTFSNYQTNPEKSSNLIFEGRPKNQWMYIYYKNIEQNDGMTDCPAQKPYFDNLSCIICPDEHPYFNLQYKMCQKCAEGTKYDKDHYECLTTAGNIATQVPTLEKMAAGIFA